MQYCMTSSEANKLLKKLFEEKNLLLAEEEQSCVFNAALGEDTESVRPKYDYRAVREAIAAYDAKIRALKHAVSVFNTTATVGDTGLTIDRVLVLIPQLNERKDRLYTLQSRLPKQRVSVGGIGKNTVIDYQYANYSVEEAKADFARVSDELRAMQTALDAVNSTVKFEFTLPD